MERYLYKFCKNSIFLFILIFIFTSNLDAKEDNFNRANYVESIFKNNSIEAIFEQHYYELDNIAKFLRDYKGNTEIVNNCKSLAKQFYIQSQKQADEMNHKGINIEELRISYKEFNEMTIEQRNEYNKNYILITTKYEVDKDDYLKLNTILSSIKPYASFILNIELEKINQYLSLIKQTKNYTYLEIYKDIYGTNAPNEKLDNNNKVNAYKANSIEATNKRIQDILKDKPIISIDKNIMVYPNPSKKQITVLINSSENTVAYLQLYDLQGKQIDIIKKERNLTIGENTITEDIQSLPKGLYTLQVNMNQETIIYKIEKQ